MTWQALPQGQSITVTPGTLYAITASVKTSHTTADIVSMALAKWGLQVTLYAEQGSPSYPSIPTSTVSGYKNVYGLAQATTNSTVPWSVSSVVGGFLASLAGDSSTILQAWSSTDPTDATNPPTTWGQTNVTTGPASPSVSAADTTVPIVAPTPAQITDYSWVPPVVPWVLGAGAAISLSIGAWLSAAPAALVAAESRLRKRRYRR